jgi:hypothetical protein
VRDGAAAEHVTHGPATGRFWQVREEQFQVLGGGTIAHPYDIVLPSVTQMWLSPVAGRRDYYYSRQLGAHPGTPADVAAWRAAGSPRRWVFGSGRPLTTTPAAPEETWDYGHGKVGYLEGDLSFLTLRQFRALPASTAGLARALRKEAMGTWSARHPGSGGATADQLIWDEALALLADPVSPRVRSAAFRVLAQLPGVRLLGRMRDPLGRSGYGIGTGRTALGEIAIIDPSTGSLLASEIPGGSGGPTPAQARTMKRLRGRTPGRHSLVRPVRGAPWSFSTCLLVAGWTSTPPPFAATARHFDALSGY